MANGVSASEQRSVLMDLLAWLRQDGVLPADTKVQLADLDVKVNTVALVPIKGVKKYKQYACGDYEVFLPFAIYYRTSAESNVDTSAAFDVLNHIGDCIEAGDPKLTLTNGREAIDFYQEMTAIKYKQEGAVSDFMANFVLIYGNN